MRHSARQRASQISPQRSQKHAFDAFGWENGHHFISRTSLVSTAVNVSTLVDVVKRPTRRLTGAGRARG
jgi:hypothetical protein